MRRRVGNSPYRQRSDVARVRDVMLEAAGASEAPLIIARQRRGGPHEGDSARWRRVARRGQ